MPQATCAQCRVEFPRRGLTGPPPKYCSQSCRSAAYEARCKADGRYEQRRQARAAAYVPTSYEILCVVCGETFTAKRRDAMYCTFKCARQGGPNRCSVDGCDRPTRARGLCSSHYNASQYTPEQRHPSSMVNCSVCGEQVRRPLRSNRRHVCSVECRTMLQHGERAEPGSSYDWAACAMSRAKRAGATVIERFDRSEVFARDDWTCRICDLPIDLDAPPFDPMSATVDHIVPLSQQGQHTLANAQCAHLSCNSAKSDAVASHSA